jgi:hypothetical protein
MTIEITRPEVEALILQKIRSGGFVDVQELILHALRAMDSQRHGTGVKLIAAMQSSPYKDVEIEPDRVAMPVRDVPL